MRTQLLAGRLAGPHTPDHAPPSLQRRHRPRRPDSRLPEGLPRQRRGFFGALFGRGRGVEEQIDICNCGADLGVAIPRHELVLRKDMERGSLAYKRQLYGAAIYWHLASTIGEREPYAELLSGKDVLEVGCMRGGGARYLAEVTGAATYVATDVSQDHVDACMKLHSPWPGLRFALADARALDAFCAPASFDAVLGVQVASELESQGDLLEDPLLHFIVGAARSLRPGGSLLLAELLEREQLETVLGAVKALGLELEACTDLSAKVSHAGFCRVPLGDTYARIVARKPMEAAAEAI